jgi:hypothetical protein
MWDKGCAPHLFGNIIKMFITFCYTMQAFFFSKQGSWSNILPVTRIRDITHLWVHSSDVKIVADTRT